MIGVLIFTTLSIILGFLLISIHHLLNKKDLKIEKIKNMLPGYNCGICGYSGCLGMAEVLDEKPDQLNKCRPIKKDDYDLLMSFLKK